MINNKEYRGILIGNVWKENKAAFSQLTDFSLTAKTPANVVGIKFVITGCENYTLNQKTQSVKDGCFLLVNSSQKLEISLNTNKPTTGLCFNIEKELLADVYNNYTVADNLLLDRPQTGVYDFNFPEIIYRPDDQLSQHLSSLKHFIDPVTGELTIEKEQLFYDLAKNMLQSQFIIQQKTWQIKATKKVTREELFKRMNEARSIIDDSILKPINMAELAACVALSEFHFYRIFKQVYGISPHQYQIRQRLERAKLQIKKGIPVTLVSVANGFADIYTFSKAFKKIFGISPGQSKKD